MVDVHAENRRVEERRLDDTALLCAVHGDEHALADVLGRLPQEAALPEPKKCILAGERLRAAEHHHRVLAELDQRQVCGEERAEPSMSGLS